MPVRKLVGVICFLAIAVWAGTRAVTMRSERDALIDLEHRFFQSIAKRELTTIRSLLADDCMVFIGNAGILSEQDVVSRVASSDRVYERNEPYHMAIRLHGDTAIVAGTLHQRYQAGGTSTDVRTHYMHTWIRSGHGWRLLSSHSAALFGSSR